MTNAQFGNLLHQRLEKIENVLANKAKEYSSEEDRLHNFKVAATITSQTPERALWGMLMKHFVSVQDIVEGLETEILLPKKELVEEKIGDLINYLILLEATIKERY